MVIKSGSGPSYTSQIVAHTDGNLLGKCAFVQIILSPFRDIKDLAANGIMKTVKLMRSQIFNRSQCTGQKNKMNKINHWGHRFRVQMEVEFAACGH